MPKERSSRNAYGSHPGNKYARISGVNASSNACCFLPFMLAKLAKTFPLPKFSPSSGNGLVQAHVIFAVSKFLILRHNYLEK